MVQTHVAATPAPKPVLPIEQLKIQLNKDYLNQTVNYFNGDKEKAMKFMSAVVHSVRKVPGLLECERTSLLNAFMACAEFNLFPSSVSGEAFVIPYKKVAQFQLGYQGIITLLYRAGIESINTGIVFEKDHFDYEEGLEPRLVHKPNVFEDRGKPIAVYAVAQVKGNKVFKVLSESDVMKFREFSQSKGSEYSPWNSKNDPELHMWRKTAIKQLAKVLPKNDTVINAIAEDNKESTINRANLDAGGPAVGRALHGPVEEPQSEAGEVVEE